MKPCQRRCIDDLCQTNSLCGVEFCIYCRTAVCFDESICDSCREKNDGDAEGEIDFEETPINAPSS